MLSNQRVAECKTWYSLAIYLFFFLLRLLATRGGVKGWITMLDTHQQRVQVTCLLVCVYTWDGIARVDNVSWVIFFIFFCLTPTIPSTLTCPFSFVIPSFTHTYSSSHFFFFLSFDITIYTIITIFFFFLCLSLLLSCYPSWTFVYPLKSARTVNAVSRSIGKSSRTCYDNSENVNFCS